MMPSWPALTVLEPWLAAAALAFVPRRAWGMWGNLAATVIGLALACQLPAAAGEPGQWLLTDPASIHLVVLDSFVGLTAAWFSRFTAPPGRLRLYHGLFQILLGCTNLALLADNTILTWIALEGGALALVLAMAAPGPPAAAAWRVLALAGAALVMTAFGTLLLYLAATPALGPGWEALRWTALLPAAARCDGTVLSLAFVLLLLGYGGLAGLIPLQGWLLEAQADAPVALGGLLAGAVPGVALLVILRLRGVLDGDAQAIAPGGPILALGLATLLLAAAGLWRGQSERRWLALSSVGQNGAVAFAFGLGGSAGTLAGLLCLTAHTLSKAASFQSGGDRWARGLAMAALAGLPPFGLFSGLILVVDAAVQRSLWLALPFGGAIALGIWALLVRPPPAATTERGAALAGCWACLAGALLFGLAMPGALAAWLQDIAAVAQ